MNQQTTESVKQKSRPYLRDMNGQIYERPMSIETRKELDRIDRVCAGFIKENNVNYQPKK